MPLLSALPLPLPLPFCVPPAACVSCVSSSLESAVSSAQCHPVLYPTSAEDPPLLHPSCLLTLLSLWYTTQLIHLWTPGPGGPHPLCLLTASPLGPLLWWHFTQLFTKFPIAKKKPSKFLTKYVCQQNISSNIYSISCKVPKIDAYFCKFPSVVGNYNCICKPCPYCP